MPEIFNLELILEIYERCEDDMGDRRCNLVKNTEYLAIPQKGILICLDPGNNNLWARVTEVVLQPYDKTDIHPTAAWVYCTLKRGDPFWQGNDISTKILKEEFGWQTS